MSALLEVTGLRGGYGRTEVLRDVDLALQPGEIVALLGSNGAGKSTLNNIVCGLVPAWSGRVRFDGSQPEGLRQNQRLATRILIEEKPNVLMVERGPFLDSEGGRAAYVVDGNGIATRTNITVGSSSLAAIEIVSGLKPGDRIVVSATDAFEDAPTVMIR